MIDKTVDLPQPEWPNSATNSPARIRVSKFFTTVIGPEGVSNTLVSDVISRGRAFMSGGLHGHQPMSKLLASGGEELCQLIANRDGLGIVKQSVGGARAL